MVKYNEILDVIDPSLREQLLSQGNTEENIIIEKARRNGKTIKYLSNNSIFYLTSKFDPINEAEKFAALSKEKIEETDNLIILGAGLGYILSSIIDIKPNINLFIVEPNHELLKIFIKTDLSKKVLKNIKYICDKVDEDKMMKILNKSYKLGGDINYLVTPGFSKVYSTEEKILGGLLLNHLKNKKSSLVTNMAFQERWALNSIKNFPFVLKTFNAIELLKTQYDLSKPAILVAAGPSLNYEFEHLKIIKQKKLAYIFAVGSAISALIRNDIRPDFFCTYDPQAHNYKVSEVLIEQDINDVTMLFGTSVGYETVERHTGPKAHFITSQDKLSSQLIDCENLNEKTINDAPSIAIMTYQLLSKAGFKEIVLVGQNLSFDGKQRYAIGIEYESGASVISDEDEKKLTEVESVLSGTVFSDEGYSRMRSELEHYIQRNVEVETINTTVNGAKINGTKFIELKDLIKKWEEKVTDNDLIKKDLITPPLLKNKIRKLEDDSNGISRLINNLSKELNYLQNTMQPSKIENKLQRIDQINEEIKNNLYFHAIINTSIKHELTIINDKIRKSKNTKSIYERKKVLVDAFENYIMTLKNKDQLFQPVFSEMINQLKEKDF
ncbi:motility associated factor glycosyltransferase family protein [Jeotgalibacillus terrae]|uniref:Motility associated factor glycosyltransferase family protein n=1 Tax=Jeotgalibacillus terrae TaxID=587735 RepID=A0ABW5ZC37_9BACL|nr:6-hydroxymethylpterin diphosphokinase MptE-like protein [Jeotgalibacillus terrae]MBM7580166.1 hypothetical protein [Jeotgalibacillus terrae]